VNARCAQRLDLALVQRGLVSSRARARDLIKRGLVEVAGKVQTKPALIVGQDEAIDLPAGGGEHVSRGAAKLSAALDHFGFDPAGVVALDIGASTGGFTDILLSRGAARVYAVDVGHHQLHARLASHARIVSLEGCDARRLDRTLIPEPVGAIVADVSFISLTKALPAALALARDGAWMVALVKPQFEAGRQAVGKDGIVRDPAARDKAVEKVCDWLAAQPHWRVFGIIPSPLPGGDGNQEFLLGAIRDA
jgi:23S rRNA (cytidine1920-2'-O)/16S rRNA (cytidine1409-2'-O)-methyltransferase